MYYAQINLATRIVEAETMPHSPIEAEHMIEITEEQYGTTLGKRHDAETGDFEEVVLPPSVPASITMRQARLVLLEAGHLASVQAAINSLSSPAKERAQIEWDYSNEVQRHNGFVATLGPALGLNDEQIDALFIAGAAL